MFLNACWRIQDALVIFLDSKLNGDALSGGSRDGDDGRTV